MYTVGIVGHGANKFTPKSATIAKNLIKKILKTAIDSHPNDEIVVISGHSPMGGIDIWTEEVAAELNLATNIKAPRQQSWEGEYGYKARNLDIAKFSNELHNIVVKEYPPNYRGRQFNKCYHCEKHNMNHPHVKSGGCWTMWKAREYNNEIHMHVIKQHE